MERSFYIKDYRLAELKLYIKENTPSVRFNGNPIKTGEKFYIQLTLTVEDSNILDVLFNIWHAKDNPVVKKSGWQELLLKRLNLS
jgi:hypothetical protein